MAISPSTPSVATAPPAVTTAAPWPGVDVLLEDRYRLEEFIAAGAAAAVWRAHDTQLGRDVAIKLLLPHRAADEVAVGRFRVEALATVRATHPNAVRVYDACSDGDMTFLVMEYVQGPSLADCDLPVTPEVAAAIGSQVAAALQAAHEHDLVHRDVKPGNVLVDHSGWVKVVDFGIARVLDAPTGLTLPHMGLGTARYAAPEVLQQGEVGPWTDVYGLGLTLWEVLVGEPAFEGDNVHQLALARLHHDVPDVRDRVDGVPDDLADAVLRCTRRDPADRFASGAEALEVFQAVSGPRPYTATRSLVVQHTA